MNNLKTIEPLKLDGNLADNWRKWYQRFELYETATGIAEKAEPIRVATFLHVIGPDALDVYNTLKFDTPGDEKKLNKVIDKFKGYCNPRSNVTYERHLFFMRNQETNETVDQYVTELRNKARTCEFDTLTESLIKDRLVCGIKEDSVRERLLREADLDLAKAVDICRACEASKTQAQGLRDGDNPQVSLIRKKPPLTVNTKSQQYRTAPPRRRQNPAQENSYSQYRVQCGKCGYRHENTPNKCPANGQICTKCKKPNHFARKCFTTNPKNQTQRRRGNVHVIEDNSDEYEEYPLFVETIKTKHGSKNEDEKDWFVTLNIENKNIKFKMDTGAQCNVLSKKDFTKLGGTTVKRGKTKKLVTYTGQRIRTVGTAMLTCEYKDRIYLLECQIVDHEVTPVIGLQTCKKLNLIQRIETVGKEPLLDEFYDVFQGLGSFHKHHIKIDKSVQPVVHPPRKVPIMLHDRVREELDRMENLGVIEKMHEPTQWVNSMVVVTKPNGKLRICVDPKDLNKAVKREHYPMKTIDDVTTKITNAKFFSKLDAECGFWQIELDEESSELCTFNTPFGRYKFKRLPFGITSAPEVFQRAISEIYDGMDGVEAIVDDILVWADTKEQHDKRLREVLEKARCHKLKLNKNKCQIAVTELKYIGHILSDKGLKPDPEKVKAIREMPEPTDKAGVQRFMGMIQYVSKFIPNLSQVSTPLRELLEKNVSWHWDERHHDSYQSLKDLISSAPVLRFYDVTKPVTLSVDASSTGLGAVLLQENQPVAFASKSLTPTQQRYAQIEKEMLAIVFGAKKFHQYIFGKQVNVQTDHKPLEIIMRKSLYLAPIRLQKMLLKLQQYDLKVEYVPGRYLHIADALSRAPLPEQATELEDEYEVNVILAVSEEKMNSIAKETEKDPCLKIVKAIILSGWPENRAEVPSTVVDYWNIRDELVVREDVIIKGDRPVIPSSMRREMLNKIHQSHLGIDKCRQCANDVIFWPGMSKDISELVGRCKICQEHRKSNQKEPLIPHEVPDRPWSKIASDLFHLKGETYLLLVDYYSEFIEISKLMDTSSETVIQHFKSQFARYGIPDIVISDNGPQYSSRQFYKFAVEYGFEHRTSSPKFPQSNGMAERAVQTVKSLFKKAKKDGTDIYLALLAHRNTPRSSTIGSPAQRLMARRTKTPLPTAKSLLIPKVLPNIKEELQCKRLKQKLYFDRSSRELPPLTTGQNVRVQTGNTWQPGRVLGHHSTPRSLLIRSNNTVYRRNRQQLRATNEEFSDIEINPNGNLEFPEFIVPVQKHEAKTATAQQAVATPQDANTTVTRSGRVVREPQFLKDYVK